MAVAATSVIALGCNDNGRQPPDDPEVDPFGPEDPHTDPDVGGTGGLQRP